MPSKVSQELVIQEMSLVSTLVLPVEEGDEDYYAHKLRLVFPSGDYCDVEPDVLLVTLLDQLRDCGADMSLVDCVRDLMGEYQ